MADARVAKSLELIASLTSELQSIDCRGDRGDFECVTDCLSNVVQCREILTTWFANPEQADDEFARENGMIRDE